MLRTPKALRHLRPRAAAHALLFAVCAAAGLALAAPAIVHADDIEADRPDLSQGPRPLAAHRVQLEAGWTRYQNTDAPLDVFGEGLLRVGVDGRVELRVLVPSWNRVTLRGAPIDTR